MHAHDFWKSPPAQGRSEQASAADRRCEERFNLDELASMKVLQPLSADGCKVRVLEISKSGLKLSVPEPLQPGMIVQVRLKTAIALAEVRYCLATESGFHAGLRLQDVFWTAAAV